MTEYVLWWMDEDGNIEPEYESWMDEEGGWSPVYSKKYIGDSED